MVRQRAPDACRRVNCEGGAKTPSVPDLLSATSAGRKPLLWRRPPPFPNSNPLGQSSARAPSAIPAAHGVRHRRSRSIKPPRRSAFRSLRPPSPSAWLGAVWSCAPFAPDEDEVSARWDPRRARPYPFLRGFLGVGASSTEEVVVSVGGFDFVGFWSGAP